MFGYQDKTFNLLNVHLNTIPQEYTIHSGKEIFILSTTAPVSNDHTIFICLHSLRGLIGCWNGKWLNGQRQRWRSSPDMWGVLFSAWNYPVISICLNSVCCSLLGCDSMDNVNRSGHLQKCPAGVLFSAEAVFVGPALRYFTSSNFIIFLAHFPTLVQFDTVLISSQHHYSASDHISRPDRKAQVITNTFCKHSFFGQRLCKHD